LGQSKNRDRKGWRIKKGIWQNMAAILTQFMRKTRHKWAG